MASAMESIGGIAGKTRYFVTKCDNIKRLYDAKCSSLWAVPERDNPPQPREILSQSLEEGSVVLIFSVSNCHGWHGVANMVTKPGSVQEDNDTKDGLHASQVSERDTTVETIGSNIWNRFKIQWHTLFLDKHGEQCLPSSKTEHLTMENGTTINKARNMQELPFLVGKELCQLIQQYYEDISSLKKKKDEEKRERLGAVFFEPGLENDTQKVWEMLLKKVKVSLGRVLLACPFGSQRYNLHHAGSDVDMFVVYAADTKDVLGFNPPPPTIKNRDTENCDYTIFEMHHFCELLINGDPRCVETLFLHPSSIYYQAPEWSNLCTLRRDLLTKQCLEKYLRDATGGKGTKLLDKWTANGTTSINPLLPKVTKLFYIIIRLLQNAREVSQGDLCVYRLEDNPERELLMKVRKGDLTFAYLRGIVDGLIDESKQALAGMEVNQTIRDQNQRCVQEWLLALRYDNFRKTMEQDNRSTGVTD